MLFRSNKYEWTDWNIPEADGEVLHDLILNHGYTRALEIGTSTGHSAMWIASALSKTGGRLITIELEQGRHKMAVKNFAEAGLSRFIDARRADAHEQVNTLQGPFDFIFSDADKEWYRNYFIALEPKLETGGCYAAHNVLWTWNSAINNYLEHVQSLSDFTTTINKASHEGISISFKTAQA